MNTPFFSIIVVSYNSQQYIEGAISSILESTFSDYEIIISDDASTDNTWGLVQSFTDRRIRAHRNPTNLGEYSNRNESIKRAKGEWLLFVDADDVLYPWGLSRMKERLSANDTGVNMVLMHHYLEWALVPFQLDGIEFLQILNTSKSLNNLAFANTLFRTEAIKKIFSQVVNFKNGDTIARMLIAGTGKVLVIEDQLTWWRETPNQASSQLKHNIGVLLNTYNFESAFFRTLNLPRSILESMEHNALNQPSKELKRTVRNLKFLNALKILNNIPINKWRSLFSFKEIDMSPEYQPTNPKKSCAEYLR